MLDIIQNQFSENGNPALVGPMKTYMKNKFEFYGIKSPARREISKPILKECKALSKKETIDLAKELWNQPQRELHYLALELLLQNLKKDISKEDLLWMEWFILKNSWWDTVDFIAPKLVGLYFKKFPEARRAKIKEWIQSENIWLIRTSLIFQLKYKKDTDLNLMFETILQTCQTREFFVNKAIGWMLRENAKTNPAIIEQFIEENEQRLSGLSKREGLKGISRN
ncbi:MAG: DNA alkylation repair protein [Crocinitomicaceae bacterium]|nr:DNA alkylation repair protein [Crocinitomicaceae bacterium]